MAIRVLVTDGMDAGAMEQLRKDGFEVVEQFYEPDQLGAALKDFDAVIIRSATKIKKQQIDDAKGGKLKLIIRAGVGMDNIDIPYAEAAGIDALDTPFTWDIHDNDGLAAETRMVKNMGFNGKACIYPGQVETVNEIFSPTKERYEWALAIVKGAAEAEAQGKGVVAVNGELVDGPVIITAKNTVAEYERIHGVHC